MTTNYLSPELVNLGYTGTTGTTPYQSSTVQQVAALQDQYANALSGSTLTAGTPNAIHLNINFDGTQNNRDFPDLANGEVMTNIGQIAKLQELGGDRENTIYMPGIGAQTTADGSPSNFESTPWKAGENGNQILEDAYRRLTTRVTQILDADPNASIELNLTGFSRGGAEAVAFANLLNERGIPGLYPPGSVPVNSLVLFDPVSQTDGGLNVNWPTNLRNPALVFVASAENRVWFPAMPVDTGAIVVPIDAIHSDVGGSFNPDGISAVTLKIAREYLTGTGSPMDEIPAELQPNWDRMYIHNSAIDNFNNVKFATVGDPTQTVGTNRYYEGTGLGSITVKDILGRDVSVTPVYEQRGDGIVLAGFISKTSQTATDETTGNVTNSQDVIIYARDGKTITGRTVESLTKDDAGQLVSHFAVNYAADGTTITSTRMTEVLSNGTLQTTTRDQLGEVVSVGERQTFDDGSTLETVHYANGSETLTSTSTDNSITQTKWNAERSMSDTVVTDATGQVISRTHTDYFYDDNGQSRIETITTAEGTVRNTYDSDGKLFKSETVNSGVQTLLGTINSTAPTLIDALKLLSAIQSGEPLPILDSGLRLANDLNPSFELSGVSNAVSGLTALLSLDAALERGDTLGAITAGAQAISYGATAYASFLQASYGDAINAAADGYGSVFDVGTSVGKALPYLNLINSIANGNAAGAAIAGLQILVANQVITGTLAAAVPVIGWAYAIYSLIDGLFGGDDIPDPWGSGQFTWEGNAIGWRAVGETGGDQAVSAVMQQTLATMNALLEQVRQQNPGSTLGLIPQRMPGLGYDMSGYRYSDINPLSGAEQHPELRFDTSGNPYNAQPGSPESFQSLVEAMVRSALARGAIAPEWEVRTAQMQTAAGDPKAGLSEEERAGRDGQLAAPVTGLSGNTQTWRPVVLDLDGDGIETSAQADGVAFDVDDSGYLKQTGWVKADDAMLVLDRNLNGQFDSARELFSNAQVALGRRGLAGMAWVDANYDGKLTAADPVWNELKLWRDLNQNGVQDAGEVQGLDAQGITELNYAMGTFTQNGQQKQLASPDLQADKDGTRVSVVNEGILIQSSVDGKLSLLVTRVDDRTAVEAGRDGLSGFEDVEVIVSAADLLANDTLGGLPGRDLTITGLSNFRHGTGFIDANGFVHFRPEADYFGDEAGFDYAVLASNGQESKATVDVVLQGVNDAPTLADVSHTTRPIYGYTEVQYATDESGSSTYVGGGQPIYQPYAVRRTTGAVIYNPAPGLFGYTYHTSPIAYEDTGSGKVSGADVDDPVETLSYEVVGKPQYGAVTVNADGSFQYTSWKEPGVPSDRIVVNGQYAGLKDGTLYTQSNLPSVAAYPTTDVFQVRITDPHGASTIQSISVPHYGPYLPPAPAGGGGKKPIAVDLNGDGFEFINLDDSNVFFDMNGDGWRRRTSWVGASDGLLVYDANGDGKIDKAEEISFVGYKDGAQTDLAGLAAFDTNGDGIFSALDEQWQRFGVWQDANSNGVTDPGELRTLAELGVESVSLSSDGRFEVVNGQTVHGVGNMTLADGGTLALADVTLSFSNEVLVRLANGETTTQIKEMFSPAGEEINGTAGNDLILGMSGSNIIYGLAGDDVIFDDGGNDIIDGGDGNDLIYSGADNDLVLGGNGDDTIYAGLGNDVVFGGDGHDALFGEGGNDVIFGGAGNDFISGGWGNDLLSGDDGDDLIFGEAGNDALFGGTGNDELHGMEGHDYLNGGDGDDWLDGGSGDDVMIGGRGNDTYVVDSAADEVIELADEGVDTVRTTVDGLTLAANVENLTLLGGTDLSGHGNELDNVLAGNDGNNTLSGGAGNDTLIGGRGNDLLRGGSGNDVYVFTRGDGHDTIEDHDATAGNMDTLRLHGIAQSDVMLAIDGDDLLLTFHGNGGSVRIRNGAMVPSDGSWSVERVEFDDGAVWQMPELWKRIVIGGPGNETFQGTDDSETFYALGGDDVIHAGGGHDSLYGGEGNDRLYGEDGDDVLDGGSNAWGGGDDYLEGGAGSDTYRYGIDQGNDVIFDNDTSAGNASSTDVLELGVGFTQDNTRVMRQGDDLVLTTTSYNQWLRIRNHYASDGSGQIEAIRFSNGQEWTAADLATVDWRPTLAKGEGAVQGSALNEVIRGGATDDVIRTGNGHNVVHGGAGSDHIILGSGNDQVWGGLGNDVLEGNDGDDELHGGEGNDVLLGGQGNDRLYGEDGDDVLDGGSNAWGGGDDYLEGGAGSDTYRYGLNQGNDVIFDNDTSAGNASSTDVLELGVGFTQDNTRVMRQGDDLVLTTTSYNQWLRIRNHYASDGSGQIEAIRFSNGQEWTAADLATVDWRPTLAKGEGAVQGSALNEVIRGGATDDVIRAGNGHNVVHGGAGNDVLQGGWGNDTLDGQAGNDWLRGGGGDDQLTDLQGNNIAEAGAGNDTIVLGDGDNVVMGGTGYDTIHLGAGSNLMLFNRGDGTDQVFTDNHGGADNAISLGGNVRYADLGLSRSGSDLVLDIAYSDRIVLRDWYGASGPSVGKLQVVIAGSEEYLAEGGDPLRDQMVEQFDFTQLVAAFDQAQQQSPGSRWSVMNSLLDAHLQGSDTAALGGELALTYAREGSLLGTTSTAANDVLGAGHAGTSNLTVGSTLDTGVQSYRAA